MALFQSSLLRKHLNELDEQHLMKAYLAYETSFLNSTKQNIVREAKEEQYQEGFIKDLFVNVLGYTLFPEPNYNIITEKKNQADSRKADGAILKNNQVRVVIELKGTNTIDLRKIEDAAFRYKNNQKGCDYVITSNFEKLRFYIDNTQDYEDFDLFNLSFEDFKKLYLCLYREHIWNDVPLNLMRTSYIKEQEITESLYDSYSSFKKKLFNDLLLKNPQIDKLLLFKKTQKLLDRCLFILFAEDRDLLPPNAVQDIVRDWQTLKELDHYIPLYDRFKKYFGYLNTGFKNKNYEIYAYNGGLFAMDDILDNLLISDEVLEEGLTNISAYDFASDVDVNILGHIFEHSLSEIEEIESEIKGEQVNRKDTKRKKDGVFYTPKYITKYIVDNTLGRLCDEKKEELGIYADAYTYQKSRSGRKSLHDKLHFYREWLLTIKILDPACGSGAFLNQTLDYLIDEHRRIDELRSSLFGDAMVLTDMDNEILENNIFGVDINEESVEIARLSLWLRTAKKGRKLTSLSGNIKVGNSLIDDPNVAPNTSFDWKREFPEVFSKGGFDVIIGNPPYVNVELMPVKDKEYFRQHYESFYKRSDLYALFIDLATSQLSSKGFVSFIVPSNLLNNLSYKLIRDRLLDKKLLYEVFYSGDKVFSDATVDTVIIAMRLDGKNENIRLVNGLDFSSQITSTVPTDYFKRYGNNISVSKEDSNLISEKVFADDSIEVGLHFNIYQGIVTGNNDAFVFENLDRINELNLEPELIFSMCRGRDIDRWHITQNDRKILYVNSDIDINIYPNAKKWLEGFKANLSERRECKNGVIPWYSLQWPRDKKGFLRSPKIMIQRTRNERLQPRIVACIDEHGLFGTEGINFLEPIGDADPYLLLGILNSKLINYVFSTKLLNLSIKADYLKKLRVPREYAKSDIGQIARDIGGNSAKLHDLGTAFTRYVSRKFELQSISNRVEDWYNLPFETLVKELKKSKARMTFPEEAELEKLFRSESEKCIMLKLKIQQLENELNKRVYQLYGLTGNEVEIVESYK